MEWPLKKNQKDTPREECGHSCRAKTGRDADACGLFRKGSSGTCHKTTGNGTMSFKACHLIFQSPPKDRLPFPKGSPLLSRERERRASSPPFKREEGRGSPPLSLKGQGLPERLPAERGGRNEGTKDCRKEGGLASLPLGGDSLPHKTCLERFPKGDLALGIEECRALRGPSCSLS